MCKIGDFVIFDDALARVDKKSTLDNWFIGEAYYDHGDNLYGWNIALDAPLFTLKDFNKIFVVKCKQEIKFTTATKKFIKEAVYWCLAREGFDFSSLK